MNILNAASVLKYHSKNELTLVLAQQQEMIQYKKDNPNATQSEVFAHNSTGGHNLTEKMEKL